MTSASGNGVNKIKKHLPKLKADIKSELEKQGLSAELINLITSSEKNLEKLTKYARAKGIQVVNTADWHTMASEEVSDKPDFKTTFPLTFFIFL